MDELGIDASWILVGDLAIAEVKKDTDNDRSKKGQYKVSPP